MALWADFIGPSYTSYSRLVECQRTVNWFTEFVESGKGKAPKALYRSPGLATFCNSALNVAVRGQFALNNHEYAIIGTHVIEIFADGTFTDYSVSSGIFVVDDGNVVQMAASSTQIMIVSGLHGYVLQLGTLAEILSPDFPTGRASGCFFLDGYFGVTIKDSQQFQTSDVLNCTVWNALDISEAESRPDFITGNAVRGEELWLAGYSTLQPYTASGDTFPFASNQSAIVNIGVSAGDSFICVNKTLFWIGSDTNSLPKAYGMQGYDPQPVSNYPVEAEWQKYPEINDAVASAFQISGHQFVQFYFPTAKKTWRMDVDTGDWTEATFWNTSTGKEEAHRCVNFVSVFGKILGGDRTNGIIYDVSMDYLDDNGTVIRRVRRAPHLSDEHKMRTYSLFQLDGNVGIGINSYAPDQSAYNPTGILSWSNDGGKTFLPQNSDIMSFGKQGEYETRPLIRRLGKARDRVFELVVDAPVDWAIAACYIEAK